MLPFNEFKTYLAEIIMFCQCIEHDLKWIHAYMDKGDELDNFERLEKNGMGTMITMLRELDESDDGILYISPKDYYLLRQMTEKRNYWCHQCCVDFVYEKDYLNSKEYDKVCKKLVQDHASLKAASQHVQQVRLKAVKDFQEDY